MAASDFSQIDNAPKPSPGGPSGPANPNDARQPKSGRPGRRRQLLEMTLLGLDWGERRMGFAVKPAGQDWPLPRTVKTVASAEQGIQILVEQLEQSGAQGLVVGLPLNRNPEQTRRIRRWCRRARRRIRGVQWFFVDESLTTRQADTISLEKPSKRPTDDLAAALILESFMQANR